MAQWIRSRRICDRVPFARRIGFACQRPDPLDVPLPTLGPNLSRIQRAMLAVRCAAAIDSGDVAESERLWCETVALYLIDAGTRPGQHDPTEEKPVLSDPHGVGPPPLLDDGPLGG